MNLSHVRALVTRPQPQAQSLAQAIEAADGQAWVMPMLAINPLPETQAIKDRLLMLDRFDLVIVTSRPAARLGLDLIDRYWPQLPLHLRWFAIGSGTAGELERFDIQVGHSSAGTDSEALLGMLGDVRGQRILIIKGTGGRPLLEEQLLDQGASVERIEVYQRSRPAYELNSHSNAVLKELESHAINVILCGSGETMTNLGYYLPIPYRARYRLLVPSERVAMEARSLGFRQVTNTRGASNDLMLEALVDLFEHRRR